MRLASNPTLKSLLEESLDRQTDYLKSAFSPRSAEQSARDIEAAFERYRTVAFSVVNSRGRPLTSPVACCLRKDIFYVPCSTLSLKTKIVRKNPAVSMTYFSQSTFALIVHGKADVVTSEDPMFDKLDGLLTEQSSDSVTTWGGEGVFLAMTPSRVLTHGQIQ